ncbi:Kae1-associated serine/threonine protein kinase [Candidatus Woesearchaeota archaeon]|nr:MAG: Kae1-associated serine/threonine protein kinase [Candidatus Woesearchaeota archaeon]
MEKVAQGAEAIISRKGNVVVKERISKGYRHKSIDSRLRKLRTRKEARLLQKLKSAGIAAPALLNSCEKSMRLEMEYLEGPKVRDVLDSNVELAREIGLLVGRLHANDIVHGDLTTSNMILSDGKIHLIDFGLSSVSLKVEDKAVDLQVLLRALLSKHSGVFDVAYDLVLEGYFQENPSAGEVVARLDVVESRGRNKKRLAANSKSS